MTKQELIRIKKVLAKIKNPDDDVRLCLTYVTKQLNVYAACRGQIREYYELDTGY